MLQKIVLILTTLFFTGLTSAHACTCGYTPETTRGIVDLTETAAQEDRYVVLVKIISEESRVIERPTYSVTIEGFVGRVIETLGGCTDTDEIFIAKALTSCSEGSVSQLEIGAIGLAMDFRENQDVLHTFICDTRTSYYSVENNTVNSPLGLSSTTTSLDELRGFNACNLSYEVFPNPSNQSIQVSLNQELIRPTLPVTLYDEGGRLVLKAKGPTIAVDQLPAAMYFLQVGNNKNTTPLVITH